MNRREKNSVVQMDAQTWRIIDGFGKGTVYSYLLAGTERAVLIDSGMGFLNLKPITDELTVLSVSVVNTHGHLDHIGSNHQYDVAYLHPDDEAVFLEHSNNAYRRRMLVGLLAQAKLPAWLLDLPLVRGEVRKFTSLPSRDNRQPLSDGQRLDLGGRTLEIIATPGHTPGSVCLLDVERRQLFSGDTVCAETILLILDHSTPVETYRQSLLRLKAMAGRFGDTWPAHHQLPLDHTWMDEYIACGEEIMAGRASTSVMSNPVGSGLVAKFGRITIAYRPDHIFVK